MNRSQRRAASRRPWTGDHLARRFAAGYRCPDCDADIELVEHAPHVFVVNVRHDDTCPTWRGMSR